MTPLENNPPSSSTSSSPILVSLPPSSDDDDDDDEDQDEANTKDVDGGIDVQESQGMNDPLFIPPGNMSGLDGVVPNDHAAMTMDPNLNRKQIQPIHLLQRMLSSLHVINSSSSSSAITNVGMELKTKFLSMLSLYSKMITSSPSNQDKVIKLLQYTLYMFSVTLGNMVTKNGSSNSSSNLSHNGNHSSDRNRLYMLVLSKWMYKLYTEFTWARYILRIVQLPSIVHASIHQTWTLQAVESENTTSSCSDNDNDTKNRFSRTTSVIQCMINYCDTKEQRQKLYNLFGKVLTYSMLWYYPTECMAYLLWMKPSLPEQDVVVVQSESNSNGTFSPLSTTTNTALYCTATSPMMMTKYRMLVSYFFKYYTTSQQQQQQRYNPNDKKTSMISKLYRVPPETWSSWSCRGWLLYVITELLQSYVQYRELSKLQKLQQEAKISDSKNDDDNINDDYMQEQNLQQFQFEKDQIKLQCIRNILYIIPCVTWSLPKWDSQPIVSNYNVNLLLWFESMVSFLQMIRTTHHQK